MKNDVHIFVESYKTIKYCNTNFIKLTGSTFELPHKTEPTKGKHDYNTCEKCQKSIKVISDTIKARFEKFPFCCEAHSNLPTANWFKKDQFKNLPSMVADKVIFTKQHIINNIDSVNWYSTITHYIDYTIKSFGQLPNGFGNPVFLSDYVQYITSAIEKDEDIDQDKKKRILAYIDSLFQPISKEEKGDDIELLLNIYERWIQTFPFELSFFKEMKEDFMKRIPLIKGKPDYNPYSKLTRIQLQTQSGLIKFLSKSTKKLLHKIDTNKLYLKATKEEKNKLEIEIILEGHKVTQARLLGEFHNGEGEYMDTIDKWLSNEITFFNQITPAFEKLVQQSDIREKVAKTEVLKIELKKHGFFSLELLKDFSEIKVFSLIEQINSNELPYQIAMIDFLGFTDYLEKMHCSTKNRLYKLVAKLFNASERSAKGNMLVLNPKSDEKRDRYTAHLHKEQVKRDYEKLK